MNKLEKEWITKAGLRATCWWVNNSHRCGYVEILKNNPLYNIEYNEEVDCLRSFDVENAEIGKRSVLVLFTASVNAKDGCFRYSPDTVFDVHGGITFSRKSVDNYPGNGDGWWFGFDCAHAGDITSSHTIQCPGDVLRSLDFVIDECESLAKQIVEFTGK